MPFEINTKTTMGVQGKRWTPILLNHDGRKEPLVLVRADEDDADNNMEIAKILCDFLNENFDPGQMPAYDTPKQLRWETGENSWWAQHPDFPTGKYNIHPMKDEGYRATLTDSGTKDLVNVGVFPSKAYAEDACEANLVTNRISRGLNANGQ